MFIRLLGDVGVTDETGWRRAGPAKRSAVLAVLATAPNRSVGQDELVHRVWGGAAPPSVRSALYSHVARLRKLLEPFDQLAIVRGGSDGYRLETEPANIDLFAMRNMADRARAMQGSGEMAQSRQLWRKASQLWSGRPLGNVDGAWADRTRSGLERERLSVLEGKFEAELALGNHTAVLADIAAAVAEHPLAEPLAALQMLALYRCGEQSAALAQFTETAHRLRDELGVEPGAAIQNLYRQILRQDRQLSAPEHALAGGGAADPMAADPAAMSKPRQLPPVPAGFVGRTTVLHALNTVLAEHGDKPSAATAVLTGMAGVGKTSLTTWWAHQVAGRFPDGQLFADLRGFSAQPVRDLSSTLATFLRGLGVPAAQIPNELDERINLYRSWTAERELLVILDNVVSAEQVRPLLPTGPKCLAVVTSRNRLSGLVASHGARNINLGTLPDEESQALFDDLVGSERTIAETAAVRRLIELCGGLPLALRIAAANLTDNPYQSIADYADQLTAGSRLAELSIAEDASAAVATAFELSYRSLSSPVARVFRLLGLVPGPDFTAEVTAGLAQISRTEASEALRALVSAHLIEPAGRHRFRFHDLVRDYAEQLCDAADRTAAVRLSDWYLHSSRAAVARLQPNITWLPAEPDTAPMEFTDAAAALSWLDEESLNLHAIAKQALADPGSTTIWLIANTLSGYFTMRSNLPLSTDLLNTGLRLAQQADNPLACAAMECGLGFRIGQTPSKEEKHFRSALRYARDAGDPQWEIAAMTGLAISLSQQGHLSEAAELCRQALRYAETAELPLPWLALNILGITARHLGRLEESVEQLQRAVALSRQTDNTVNLRSALGNLSLAYLDLGELAAAYDAANEALQLSRNLADPNNELNKLNNLGKILLELGDVNAAAAVARQGFELAAERGRWEDHAHLLITYARTRLEDRSEAVELAEQALRQAGESNNAIAIVEARLCLAEAYGRGGGWREAAEHAGAGAELATRHGFAVMQGKALTMLAKIALAEGDRPGAASLAERAVTGHRTHGHRMGEARALVVQAQAINDPAEARRLRRQATHLFEVCGAGFDLAEAEPIDSPASERATSTLPETG